MGGSKIVSGRRRNIENPRLAGEATFRIAPITGDATDIAEALTGRDAFSGEQLSVFDVGITRFSAALPLIPGKGMRLLNTEIAQRAGRAIGDYKIGRIIKQAESGAEQIKVASREQAIEAGMRFVGESPIRTFGRDTGLPNGWRNADETRIFREPAPKDYAGGREVANLETKIFNPSINKMERVTNTHLIWD